MNLFEKRIKTSRRVEFIDISREINRCVKESGVEEGLAVVFVPHTTAGVTINENGDIDVRRDLEMALYDIVPKEGFKHFEGNSDSHTKALITGQSESLIVHKNNIILGTWQSVYFSEYDGPRTRKYYVKIIEG